jgi:hypothetical protein
MLARCGMLMFGKEVTGDPRYRKINMETQHIVRLRETQTPITVN